jgi:hypothetical protein
MKPGAPNSSRYKNGIYPLRNMSKYIGDPSRIFYRSSLEFKFCLFCDNNPRVIKWGSEIVVIPYVTDIRNGDGTIIKRKTHNYWVDYYMEMADANGEIAYLLIEVKPLKEVSQEPPPLPLKKTEKAVKNYYNSLITWDKNIRKWSAAKEYCAKRGWEFMIVTEKELEILVKSIITKSYK